MTEKTDARTDAAKGAARETIGKLIGDDAEAEAGRAAKDAARRRPPGRETDDD